MSDEYYDEYHDERSGRSNFGSTFLAILAAAFVLFVIYGFASASAELDESNARVDCVMDASYNGGTGDDC